VVIAAVPFVTDSIPAVSAPIIPGAEPWSHQGGSHGVLVLHGFTGNPQSMRPLAEAVAAAGFTVDLPLLPGHGTSVEDMLPTRWEDWSGAAEAAYGALAERCDKVLVSGLSMGGTLTCWLAEHHPGIAGIAVINPMVDPPSSEFRDVIRGLLADGAETVDGIGSDIAKEGAAEASYPGTPLAGVLSLFEGVDMVVARLGDVRCPALLLSSRVDHVVPIESGDVFESSVGGPIERVFLERSYHVATLDWDAQLIEERVVAFAGQVLGGPGAVAA
jgi:carboxylesterase